MTARLRRRLALGCVCVIGLLSACRRGHSNDPLDVASLHLTCTPASHGVHCQLLALFRDVSRPPRDVTANATWRLSGVAGARISPGGLIAATDPGDLEIQARYQSHRVRASARLTPGGPGQMLATLRGRLYVEKDGTLRPIGDVHVEVVGGPGAGRSTTTLGDGSYEFVGLVPGDVVIRATRVGCTATERSTQIHPGENRLSLPIEVVPRTRISWL